MANDGALTVSTHCSISRKNFELAPKALKIVTPAMVSLYMEYKGERVTESDIISESRSRLICGVTYQVDANLCCTVRIHSQLKVRLSQNVNTPKE